MSKTPGKTSHGGRRPGAGRPPQHTEAHGTLSVYVPLRTIRALESHAADTGQTVSEVVAGILAADTLDTPPPPATTTETPTAAGGYNPRTGSY